GNQYPRCRPTKDPPHGTEPGRNRREAANAEGQRGPDDSRCSGQYICRPSPVAKTSSKDHKVYASEQDYRGGEESHHYSSPLAVLIGWMIISNGYHGTCKRHGFSYLRLSALSSAHRLRYA